MSKKMMFVGFAVVLSAVTALNVKVALDANRSYDLTMASIAAISQEEGGKENGGKENNDQDDQENNSEGLNNHLQGKPKGCTIYRNVHIGGSIIYSENSIKGNDEWTCTKISGIEITCLAVGRGCAVSGCQILN